MSMKKIASLRNLLLPILTVALFLALPACASSEVRFGLENQRYPLLPSFYERYARSFAGLTAAYPVLPRLEIQGGISRSLPFGDGAHQDETSLPSHSWLFRGGVEYRLLQLGPARLHLGAGLVRLSSSWQGDDRPHTDPMLPKPFRSGSYSQWALEAAPRIELFREQQQVDWSVSFALPLYHGIGKDLNLAPDVDAQAFREDYFINADIGFRMAVGLGFGL